MRRMKATLLASIVFASLYAGAGTAWARSESIQRGTAWTQDLGPSGQLGGASWELLKVGVPF
jgi:hypothetical protein